MEDRELTGLPESLGTKKCYFCGKEPPENDTFWEKFILHDGKPTSVPECDECATKPNCVCPECGWVGSYGNNTLAKTVRYPKDYEPKEGDLIAQGCYCPRCNEFGMDKDGNIMMAVPDGKFVEVKRFD